MANVLFSIKSKNKIVHYTDCFMRGRMRKQNVRLMDSMDEALNNGYHVCSFCSTVAKKYRQERLLIEKYSRENHLKFSYSEGVIHIISRHDCWRILAKNNAKSLMLYHKNTYTRCGECKDPIMVNGYHCQLVRKNTILSCLRYIVQHDNYRDVHSWIENPPATNKKTTSKSKPKKGTKRYKKEQKKKKRRKRRAAIIRVYSLIDELHNVS